MLYPHEVYEDFKERIVVGALMERHLGLADLDSFSKRLVPWLLKGRIPVGLEEASSCLLLW